MTNKALRILIAEKRPDQLLRIEKILNQLGYYRVAPVRTFDELALLTSNSHELFDLLISDKDFASSYGVDMATFCRARPQIMHTLFYAPPRQSNELTLNCEIQPISLFLTEIPGPDSLSSLMSIIDPPSQWECLTPLTWLYQSVQT